VIAALTLGAIVGFTLPHLLRFRHVSPVTAAVIWTSALSLRALTAILAAGWLVLYFPETRLFEALTHWCWPGLMSTELNGHDVGHITTLLPVLFGVVSLASLSIGTVKVTRALRRLVAESAGGGPAGSVIIGGRDIVLAVAGLRRPRVLVSAGALLQLGDDELAAALAHEQAHIDRRHRYVLVYAELCHALAHLLPGTQHAIEELAFNLERDADRGALARRADRGALAAALTKAATVRIKRGALAMALRGSRVQERIEEITGDLGSTRGRASRAGTAVASTLVCLAVVTALAVPPVFVGGADAIRSSAATVVCDDA
jgi:hypothetical protein